MRTVQKVEDEKKVIQKRLNELQEELSKISAEEQKAVDLAGEDLLFGSKKAAAGPDPSAFRARREALMAAVELAKRKIGEADAEISDIQRVQEAERWGAIEKEINASLARLRELVGKSGAKGELDHLGDLTLQAQPLAGKYSQDAESRVTGLLNLWRQGTDDLMALWTFLENDKPGRPGPKTDSETGEIVGFGRMII